MLIDSNIFHRLRYSAFDNANAMLSCRYSILKYLLKLIIRRYMQCRHYLSSVSVKKQFIMDFGLLCEFLTHMRLRNERALLEK